MADEDNGSGEQGAKTPEELIAAQAASNEAFQKTMKDTMVELQQTVTQSIQGLAQTIAKGNQPPDDSDGSRLPPSTNSDGLSEADLEAMPRKEFMELMTSTMTAGIKKDLIDPMQQSLTETRETSAVDKMKLEVEEVRKGNPDFDEWKKEMGEMLRQAPGLAVKDALTLARNKDPDKVKELEEKFPPASSDDGQQHSHQNSSNNEQSGFGGMRGGNQNDGERKTDMSKEDSSNAAWDEIMADINLDSGERL